MQKTKTPLRTKISRLRKKMAHLDKKVHSAYQELNKGGLCAAFFHKNIDHRDDNMLLEHKLNKV